MCKSAKNQALEIFIVVIRQNDVVEIGRYAEEKFREKGAQTRDGLEILNRNARQRAETFDDANHGQRKSRHCELVAASMAAAILQEISAQNSAETGEDERFKVLGYVAPAFLCE